MKPRHDPRLGEICSDVFRSCTKRGLHTMIQLEMLSRALAASAERRPFFAEGVSYMSQTIPTAAETKPGGAPRKPPGPRSLPPLGSAPAFARDTESFTFKMWRRYGDLVRVRFLLWPGYLLYPPDHVKYILHDHHRNSNKQSPLNDPARPLLRTGPFTSTGCARLHQERLREDFLPLT